MNQKIQYYFDLITSYMREIPLDGEPVGLYEPVSYCLENGGKRMRPLMTLLACEMFDGDIGTAVPPAVGLELFHNFTLMHDDIMDNAPLRRNQPSVHVKWGINSAILSGDALFALACKYVSDVPDKMLRPILDLYYKTVIEVCEGQQYDMDFESKEVVSTDEYINMIRLKTAVLPAACLKAGAIVADASAEAQEKIYRYGEFIGIAFQLRDDWLDVFGDASLVGKQTGGDIVANKKTWLYIQAMETGNERQRRTLTNAFNNLIGDNNEKVRVVKDIYDELGLSDMAQENMNKYYARAFDHLEDIIVPEARKVNLKELARELFDRKK